MAGVAAKKEDVSFTGILGSSPTVKLWEFLLLGRNYEYNIKDLAKGSHISRPTCYAELKALMGKKVVIKGGKYKGKQLYKLNQQSSTVKAMITAFQHIIYDAK